MHEERPRAVTMEKATARAMFHLGATDSGSAVSAEAIQKQIDYWVAEGFLEPDGDGFTETGGAREFFTDLIDRAKPVTD